MPDHWGHEKKEKTVGDFGLLFIPGPPMDIAHIYVDPKRFHSYSENPLLTPQCADFDELERHIDRLKKELDKIGTWAKKEFETAARLRRERREKRER